MTKIKSPYISRVKIKNFRNFKDIDVNLSHKQVIIGENNVGKTNFLKAIQIILDPKFSDEDRFLNESDFYDGLVEPMKNGEIIEIIIEIRGYEHNKTVLSMLSDATISENPPTLRLTYKFFPSQDTNEYTYTIFQGDRPEVQFTHFHRKFLNIKVINAIRDVESEMRNSRKSPIKNLLRDYEFDKDELEDIGAKLKEQSNEILSIDELIDLEKKINNRFINTMGNQSFSKISLETIDVDPNRILNTLKLMIGEEKQRPTSDTSLGINNILYISLILISLEDKTIPTLLKKENYIELSEESDSEILEECYVKSSKGNYFLKDNLDDGLMLKLYSFMDNYSLSKEGFTILAIEEPEAHLHPSFQRIIYKDVMKNNTSVLMTTHSPYITSVAPLNSIVHLRTTQEGTIINTTADLNLSDKEKQDLERYIDVKRGEIYFGKGVILVEGIAEEYLIPAFAEILGKPLDLKGIICCNINSTNFDPYVKFLDMLGIPYVCITDGDYYAWVKEKEEPKRKYHIVVDDSHISNGYLGLERIGDLLVKLQKINNSSLPKDLDEQEELFAKNGFFIGYYTMEVDIMDACSESNQGKDIICNIFNELTTGGERQKENFKRELNSGDYWSCLRKIENCENEVGKGRFAQRLSLMCIKDHIPKYIENAIDYIYSKIEEVGKYE
ncbi:ATP-dependent endonuclease of the OLD family [Caldibacillus thermoamylovorans]|uniref:ATP-dependent endonuclease of the OLD family n=1 Tax=Caldibacillus thermoamylovorans TaxID=35841 RepID=A0A090J462_9BACI|nr:AAA family ATPase [Caldibacillus thermoamylovorans]CEE02675.1 ATP-dependent endonuclease of the OLD family [Caldibacillus thermoamylovorans]